MYEGKKKLILKYLSFLIVQYDMNFEFQSFKEYHGFCGPIDTYSFHNKNGCFTILHAVQRNEIEYYVSKEFSREQEILFEVKISDQVFKILKHLRMNPLNWFKRDNVLVANYIASEIKTKGEFFEIKVKNSEKTE